MTYLVARMWKNGKKETNMKDLSDQPAPSGSTATLKRDVLEKMLDPSVSCVKLYAQQHFTSCFIVYFSLTLVLVITESSSEAIFCSLPSSPESRIHQNFRRQISDDDV
ncbi:hypothetical protein T07_5013 [Trichinella nelsoni]|uniref:Uncharacterized protein n=1 Tax=Trichinella nelsoni TaxID=6336 RepID=A0A0V0RHE0_9BILA|nr:hypothetical protein T07_5013 [Trichinella nelsoni]